MQLSPVISVSLGPILWSWPLVPLPCPSLPRPGTSWQLLWTEPVVPPWVLEWYVDIAQVGKVQGMRVRPTWVQMFTLPLNCVNVGKSLNLPEPQFPYRGVHTCLRVLLWEIVTATDVL